MCLERGGGEGVFLFSRALLLTVCQVNFCFIGLGGTVCVIFTPYVLEVVIFGCSVILLLALRRSTVLSIKVKRTL